MCSVLSTVSSCFQNNSVYMGNIIPIIFCKILTMFKNQALPRFLSRLKSQVSSRHFYEVGKAGCLLSRRAPSGGIESVRCQLGSRASVAEKSFRQQNCRDASENTAAPCTSRQECSRCTFTGLRRPFTADCLEGMPSPYLCKAVCRARWNGRD